ncbi:Uncharacterized protein PECH_006530 [Penicillium ucsense]|uniref:VWFA domain-containing protein n=1 Tax=Penicillium ucsense TaxID=2839758 RepID=A0A8J8W1J5_9EURO|nr:Uncharacterized protein PECM_006054 [Penicillium ucsense]KAF7735528.1 Uncharacterized protein PECH_006530 [Penicillium ucsense]
MDSSTSKYGLLTPPRMWSSYPARARQPDGQRCVGSQLESTRVKSSSTAAAAAASAAAPSVTPGSGRSPRSSIFSFGRSKPTTSRPNDLASWEPPSYEESQQSAPAPPRSNTSAQSSIGSPNDDRFAFLADFDTIFLVDDSASMSGARWKEAEKAISAIAPICTQHDADGIDIYFLNHRNHTDESSAGAYTHVTTASDVRTIFRSVRPVGSTPLGHRLHQILYPYLWRVQAMQTSPATNGGQIEPATYVKPVNIIAITDGEFTDDAESIIIRVAQTLDHVGCLPWQVGIQFFQIGEDERLRQYLQELDDELGNRSRNGKMRDIVDTVPWRGRSGQRLDAEGILKCVLGAVNKKYDRRSVQ